MVILATSHRRLNVLIIFYAGGFPYILMFLYSSLIVSKLLYALPHRLDAHLLHRQANICLPYVCLVTCRAHGQLFVVIANLAKGRNDHASAVPYEDKLVGLLELADMENNCILSIQYFPAQLL